MRGSWSGVWLAVAVGCADPASDPTGPSDDDDDAIVDAEACLEALGDAQRAEVWFSGGSRLLQDGAEVGYDYASQGGLFTPYVVRLWGRPELYLPSEYEGQGRVWARWSTTDPDGSYVLAETDQGVMETCVPEQGADSFLELELHAQYFGEGGSTHDGMAPDELRDRPVSVSFAFGPHPEPTGTAWGNPTFPDGPEAITLELEYTVTLTEGVPL